MQQSINQILPKQQRDSRLFDRTINRLEVFMQRDKIMNNKDWNAIFGQQECVRKYQILKLLKLPNNSKLISFLLKWYLGLWGRWGKNTALKIYKIVTLINQIYIFVGLKSVIFFFILDGRMSHLVSCVSKLNIYLIKKIYLLKQNFV